MDTTNMVDTASTGSSNLPDTEQLIELGSVWGLRIIGFLLVLIIGMWVARIVRKIVIRGMEKKSLDPTLVNFLSALVHIVLQAFVIITALGYLDVPTASFVTILGAAGLAVGLALQGSLSNFASGVLMIIFKPISLGDFVEVGGVKGGVKEITVFTTVLTSPDNKRIIVPNSQVMGGTITNFNANKTRRVDMVAGISYSDDIDKAKAILMNILESDERILKDPAPVVAMNEMADSSVNFVVRPWCDGADYWGVFFDTTEAIKKRFDEEGVSIPFPQRDVHLYEHKAE